MGSIWILNHYAILPEHGGGTRHFDFARELTSRGYGTTIFASSYNHFSKKEMLDKDESIRMDIVEGVKYVRIRTKPYYHSNGALRILNMFSYFIQMIKVYKIYEKPDIIIGSSVHPFAWLAGYLISKQTGAKFICEIRDLWPQTLIDMGAVSNHHPLTLFFRFLERFIYKRASSIITLLPGFNEYICHLMKGQEGKIVYIPNGVDTERYDGFLEVKSDKLDEQLLDILDGYFCCVYIGSHGIANCIDTIVESAGIIENRGFDRIRYVLIGNGTEKDRMINYCKENGIKNTAFFDSVSKELIPIILKNSKVNLISMKKAGIYKYGISLNKLYDSMYSARPVVFAGDVYNNAVKNANAGIVVEPENPEKMAEAVLKLYEMSASERNMLGNNGREYVRKNHDIKYLVDKLEECF